MSATFARASNSRHRKRANPQLVKIHRTYTAEEVARLFDLHRKTVWTWVKEGLPTVDAGKPMLILGSELAAFLRARRQRNRKPCGPGYLYCVVCRSPRKPAGAMADFQPITARVGNLVGLCPVCDRWMNRRVSIARLSEVARDLDVRLPEAQEHIG